MTVSTTPRAAPPSRPRTVPLPPPFAPRTLLSRALAVPLVLGLALFLPLVVVSQPGDGPRDAAFWLQVVLTVYCGVRLSAMVLTTRRKLLQATFWMFCYMAMGVAPLAQAVLGRVPTPVVGPREDLVQAVALVLLGCFAFDVGALLARYRTPWHRRGRGAGEPARGGSPDDRPVLIHRRRLHLLVLAAFACGGLLIVKLGGPAVFFSSRQEIIAGIEEAGVSGDGGQAGQAFLRGFGTVPPLIALLVHTRWLITSRRARRTWSVVAVFGALVVLNAVVNNPISNPRYWFLTVLFALLFTAFPTSAAMYRASLSLGVVVALLVFPFADRFRYDENNTPQIETTSFLEPLALKDYDQVGMFANTITYVESGQGHTYGYQAAGSLLFAVPRSMWAQKPSDTGVTVGEWMGAVNTNLSSPVWAELWIDFGPVGMTAGMAALGYAAARVDRRVARRAVRGSPPGSLLLITAPLVAGYSFILVRGPLLQATGKVAIAALCLALIATYRRDRGARLG
ncbi:MULTISPECIES: hypothetical protein [Streptomyces]|uniref:Oligosaccharide repeat unit polymerase n=1 Tax=Streptomyces changanensis TaxID=2964669 RepID=A0ABY5N7V5_9ACTN|nr:MULTISPECIES: hypothetical protein [Streptomyces]UUS31420.1 hypothetical protein NRO40_11640 [Streptomyces changanensis]